MIESLKARVVIVLGSIFIACAWVMPNFVKFGEEDWWFHKDKIVYGLDIQGGLHLVMGVDVQGVIKEKTARLASSFKTELNEEGVAYSSVAAAGENNSQIRVELNSAGDVEKLKAYIERMYTTTLQVLNEEGTSVDLRYYDATVIEYKKQVIEQAIEVIRNRIDGFGVAEPSIVAQGEDRILVQLPGIEDSAGAKELINRAARLEFQILSDAEQAQKLPELISEVEKVGNYTFGKKGLKYNEYLKRVNEDLKGKIPDDTKVVFQKIENAKNLEAGKFPVLVTTTTDLSGNELEDASVRPGEYGEPEVNFRFNVDGRRKFAKITGDNVGKQMAIILDGVVQSAPSIQGKINTDSARITLGQSGNYQQGMEEANFIATALRAGALPAALEQLEERTVGPTLGADSIAKGKKAGIIGALLVLLFMAVYYRVLGLIANLALALNILFILAILTSLGATLTLPGIAGIILTVGMAVDANVIIFERIKEELRKGAGTRSAIKDGFGHAFSAIFDANLTTAAVCIVLMYYGTGPVRGFAVTLICGIVTSMFTAIFVSRVVLDILTQKLNVKKIAAV